MMGLPVLRYQAEKALEMWGQARERSGTRGFDSQSAFVPRARGISSDWESDDDEVAGLIVYASFTEFEQLIIKVYFGLLEDKRPEMHPVVVKTEDKNLSRVDRPRKLTSGNMTVVLNHFKNELDIDLKRSQVKEIINSAVDGVQYALSYPSMVVDVRERVKQKAA